MTVFTGKPNCVPWVGITLGVVIGLGLGICWYVIWYDSYPSFAKRQLDGKIRLITFRTNSLGLGREVDVTDAHLLEDLRAWLLSARALKLGSYPGRDCDMEITMEDGRRISMRISPTEYAVAKPPRGVLVEWDDYVRVGEAAPFLKALRSSEDRTQESDDQQ